MYHDGDLDKSASVPVVDSAVLVVLETVAEDPSEVPAVHKDYYLVLEGQWQPVVDSGPIAVQDLGSADQVLVQELPTEGLEVQLRLLLDSAVGVHPGALVQQCVGSEYHWLDWFGEVGDEL